MKTEYEALITNKTWILVARPKDKQILTNRWVFKVKRTQDSLNEKYKARLVARGYTQKKGINYEEVFAPVARYEIIRTLFAAAVNDEMHIHQMDVISAYVQGELSDEIYMEQPEMFVQRNYEDKVCKLQKPLYGLKQSGREWYRTFNNFITNSGGKRTPADPCVYVFNKGEDRVIVILYIDDLILASRNIKKIEEIKTKLKSEFKMTDLGSISNILGINVRREGLIGAIHLSQEKYVNELLEKFCMTKATVISTPVESNIKVTGK